MKLIDADALREQLEELRDDLRPWKNSSYRVAVTDTITILDAAPSITCAADNQHGLVPSKCPTCGEELVPAPCMEMAQDSFRAGILYGQEHPEWRADT